ncbi:MAG: UDP-N-acetylmuramoyl-tripeptide--D-alanyl-D-alanine ligase [Bacteroidales bacterium]|nr:UDP-N-acetylmuramoyl-tripeptide--D-alanyl-D-alanine ligase [Bacteroidales bacterium]
MPVEELYSIYRKYPDIVTDSRKISKDCLFFALKGDNFDGNAFAGDAISKGAAYAIIDHPAFAGKQTILVDDVLLTLQELARHHRSTWEIPVIGITGTNGKTTTKELIYAVLSSHFKSHATQGNLNNHIGVPLTLLSSPLDTEIAIIEMGANHPGEIAELCAIADPAFGIITNIGKAHLEGFGGFEGVIRTKNELYQHIQHSAGTAFVNSDNDLLWKLSTDLKRVSYGTKPADYASGYTLNADPFLEVCWQKEDQSLEIQTQLTGDYNFENVMVAICIGQYFGVPDQKIKTALEDYTPTNSRSQTLSTARNKIILDAYNANPTSMIAALKNFSKIQATRKMAILGDMLELGEESQSEHKAIVELLSGLHFENVILVGPEFQKCAGTLFTAFPDAFLAHKWLKEKAFNDFTILVKGSRGIRMEQVLDAL